MRTRAELSLPNFSDCALIGNQIFLQLGKINGFILTKAFDILIVMMPSIAAALYAVAGTGYIFKRDYPWACVWIAYALANVGLVLIGLRK